MSQAAGHWKSQKVSATLVRGGATSAGGGDAALTYLPSRDEQIEEALSEIAYVERHIEITDVPDPSALLQEYRRGLFGRLKVWRMKLIELKPELRLWNNPRHAVSLPVE